MATRSGVSGELVTITSATGLLLDGLLFEAPRASTIVVHIHGSYGNFFQAPFLRMLVRRYLDAGVSVLAVNVSAHDGFGEGNFSDGDFRYVGGAVSNFDDCVQDIRAMVEFATSLADRVVLQGHSLGCDRVLHYSIEQSSSQDLVLLSPCDSYALQRRWLEDETVEDQIARLSARPTEGQQFDWINEREYGLRQGPGWTYTLPITRKAFLSIANGPPYKLINIQSPAEFRLALNAAVYIGGDDALQTSASDDMFQYLAARFRTVKRVFVDKADHMLVGGEELVADAVIEWIRETALSSAGAEMRNK